MTVKLHGPAGFVLEELLSTITGYGVGWTPEKVLAPARIELSTHISPQWKKNSKNLKTNVSRHLFSTPYVGY
jgi:hypothetical protein